MTHFLLSIFDVILLTLAVLRLSRLVMTDDLGKWYVLGPAIRWCGATLPPGMPRPPLWRSRLASGLTCPFCVGFWIGVLGLISLELVGGPGNIGLGSHIWRILAGFFALNYVVGHVAARMGDTPPSTPL